MKSSERLQTIRDKVVKYKAKLDVFRPQNPYVLDLEFMLAKYDDLQERFDVLLEATQTLDQVISLHLPKGEVPLTRAAIERATRDREDS